MQQPRFIAEVSSNHNQDLNRCLAFIDKAAALGFDTVKFQLFRINQLFAPEILARSEEHRARRAWELPPAFLPLLAERCRQQEIGFTCTPFDLDAVTLLEPHVADFKIASYELTWDDLLKACAQTGKPVILSTGMANMDEVSHAVSVLRAAGCAQPTLLHCSSAYPTPAEDANLAAMDTLAQAFDCPIGWSDHTRDPAVLYRAVHAHNAEVVELHLDLDQEGAEFKAGHCWLPEEIGPVIETVHRGFRAEGDGRKQANAAEEPERLWRADPEDGLRPFQQIRADFKGGAV